MKKVVIFVIVLCLLYSLSGAAFAAGEEIIEENTDVVDNGTSVYVDNDIVIAEGVDVLTGVSTYTSREITPQDASGLKAALLSILGNYDAIIVDYEYQNTVDNVTTHVREVQPDYVWLCSAGVLALFVFCLFKLGVAVWKR